MEKWKKIGRKKNVFRPFLHRSGLNREQKVKKYSLTFLIIFQNISKYSKILLFQVLAFLTVIQPTVLALLAVGCPWGIILAFLILY
jgi:hypothetical protein